MDIGNDYFIRVAKEYVVYYTNGEMTDKTPENKITTKDIYVVWLNKTLKNNRALLSTTVEDGVYYEFTYNGDKDEFYFDAYKHENNYRIKHS